LKIIRYNNFKNFYFNIKLSKVKTVIKNEQKALGIKNSTRHSEGKKALVGGLYVISN